MAIRQGAGKGDIDLGFGLGVAVGEDIYLVAA
jgi:hypothetical protein